MALLILRVLFILVASGLSVAVFDSNVLPNDPDWLPLAVFGGIMLAAALIIAADIALKHKRIDTISSVYFGLLIGLLLTYVIGIAMRPLLESTLANVDEDYRSNVRTLIQLLLGMILCYSCVSFLLQTKDDFRFVIPYVEFAKEVKGLKPYVLDTSAVIDGRIADVAETQALDNKLIMPRFRAVGTAEDRRQ